MYHFSTSLKNNDVKWASQLLNKKPLFLEVFRRNTNCSVLYIFNKFDKVRLFIEKHISKNILERRNAFFQRKIYYKGLSVEGKLSPKIVVLNSRYRALLAIWGQNILSFKNDKNVGLRNNVILWIVFQFCNEFNNKLK